MHPKRSMDGQREDRVSSHSLWESSRRLRDWSAEEVERSKRIIRQSRVLKEMLMKLNISTRTDMQGYDDGE